MPILTKFERTNIIGLRATHLSMGSKPLIDNIDDYSINDNIDLIKIAEIELDNTINNKGKPLPYTIIRKFPENKIETIKLEQFQNTNDLIPKTFIS
mgnify:CR=1 FL=1